jgi:hypothetical protein
VCTAYTAAPVHSLFAPEGHPPIVDCCSVISPVQGGGYAAFTACPVHSPLSPKGNEAIVDRGALTHHHKGGWCVRYLYRCSTTRPQSCAGVSFSRRWGWGYPSLLLRRCTVVQLPAVPYTLAFCSQSLLPPCAHCAPPPPPPPPSLLQSTHVWTSCGS